jgi:putative DNA methylase
MAWDFVEVNPFGEMANIDSIIETSANILKRLPTNSKGVARQIDAAAFVNKNTHPIISTDPPYYDNIGYADLSDFFYVWLRPSLGKIYPNLFSTLLVPKTKELVASPYRFDGDKKKARKFFEEGLKKAFVNFRKTGHKNYPITIFYAFKQTEKQKDNKEKLPLELLTSTGWETMLQGILDAEFQITGTWPLRTERSSRSVGLGTNALASSILLVCRNRSENAPITSRRDFLTKLKKELPNSLKTLQNGNIAPVDMAQSAIGPGMAIFSQYRKVIEADGTPMTVRSSLALINQVLDEYLSEQEGEYDSETRFALAWFEQNGMESGPFGVAETLSKAKNTAIDGLTRSGILEAKAGKVRILSRAELPENWKPAEDKRISVWKVSQYLIKALLDKGSEEGAAELLSRIGALGETARDLSYRLYTICDRKNWAQEAMAYNSLVVAWPELVKLASQKETTVPTQQDLF